MTKILTQEAEDQRREFERDFGDVGCRCHISPPCFACTHPGNPLNQEEDESCWMEDAPAKSAFDVLKEMLK